MDTGPEVIAYDRLGPRQVESVSSLVVDFKSHVAMFGIIASGRVGVLLPCTVRDGGYWVAGLDVDPAKVAWCTKDQSCIAHIASDERAQLMSTNRLAATTDFACLRDMAAA